MSRRTGPLRLLIAVVVSSLGILAPSSARAHTEFDFSLPADGESVDAPLEGITVAFTLPVTIVGNGFEVLTPDGEIVEPAVSTDDDREFRLMLDPPLSGGDVGVRYEVRAEDGHVLADGFAFTVGDAPDESTVPTTVPTTAPPTAAAVPATTAVAAEQGATATSTPAPTPAPNDTAPEEALNTTASVSDGSDGGDRSAVIWVAIGVIGVGAGAFLFVRARRAR